MLSQALWTLLANSGPWVPTAWPLIFYNLIRFDPALLLHGEQYLEIYKPLPTSCRVRSRYLLETCIRLYHGEKVRGRTGALTSAKVLLDGTLSNSCSTYWTVIVIFEILHPCPRDGSRFIIIRMCYMCKSFYYDSSLDTWGNYNFK